MGGEAPSSGEAVRAAGPPDAARLARLRYEFRAAEDPAVEGREAFLERCEPWMRERLAPERERWRCWVVEPGTVIRGHVWVRLVPKVPNPADEPEAHAYLTNMFVEPEHRGRGLGAALMERAVSWGRERDLDSLILWPTEESRSLYRRFGCAPSRGLFELDLAEA